MPAPELPSPPWWWKIFEWPARRTRAILAPPLQALGLGLIVGGAIGVWGTGLGLLITWFTLMALAWYGLGQALAGQFWKRWLRSDEGTAYVAERKALGLRVEESYHDTLDWMTKAANNEASPLSKLGFDSTVGMLVVIRRDQRVTDEVSWVVQVVRNTDIAPSKRLSMDLAAVITHNLSHRFLAAHRSGEEDGVVGLVEVRGNR
jgi:hypothetical protein